MSLVIYKVRSPNSTFHIFICKIYLLIIIITQIQYRINTSLSSSYVLVTTKTKLLKPAIYLQQTLPRSKLPCINELSVCKSLSGLRLYLISSLFMSQNKVCVHIYIQMEAVQMRNFQATCSPLEASFSALLGRDKSSISSIRYSRPRR